MNIPTGTYRHFKGGLYNVLGVAQDSETKELLVVYTPLYNDSGLWVRPLKMFQELVGDTPRFQYVPQTKDLNHGLNKDAVSP